MHHTLHVLKLVSKYISLFFQIAMSNSNYFLSHKSCTYENITRKMYVHSTYLNKNIKSSRYSSEQRKNEYSILGTYVDDSLVIYLFDMVSDSSNQTDTRR